MAADLIPINFAIQSYKSRSGLASAERMLNMYAEPPPKESKSQALLIRTPGVEIWKAINNFVPVYGMKVMGNFLYVVVGLDVYQINASKTTTLLGAMNVAPGRVMMTENGTQVTILTESGISYYYDINTTLFLQITSPNYRLSTAITTLDNYTTLVQQDSQNFQISQNKHTETYAALDFAAAESNSDNLVTVLNYKRQLYLIGATSTEIWYDTGNNTFPFQRIDGALIQCGTTAKYSAIVDLTGVYWLGSDRIIYRTTNYTAERISTYGIENELAEYDVIDDAFAFVYVRKGHRFYCLQFPTENKSWIFDITTNLWHERSSVDPEDQASTNNIWLANCHATFGELELIGDANTGTIYQIEANSYTENQIPILWEMISATQFDNYKQDSVGRFVLWMDTGTGITIGQGSDPQIMMQSSRDGGKTWSDERWQSMGQMGNYCTEIWWDQVEFGRNMLIRLRGSDPVAITITGAFIEINQGRP